MFKNPPDEAELSIESSLDVILLSELKLRGRQNCIKLNFSVPSPLSTALSIIWWCMRGKFNCWMNSSRHLNNAYQSWDLVIGSQWPRFIYDKAGRRINRWCGPHTYTPDRFQNIEIINLINFEEINILFWDKMDIIYLAPAHFYETHTSVF